MSRVNGSCVSSIRRREPESFPKKRVLNAAPASPGTIFVQGRRRGHCRLLASAPRRLLLLRRSRTGWKALHAIECAIRGRQEFFNGLAVLGEYGGTDAHRDWRTFSIVGDAFADSRCHLLGSLRARLREDYGKFVASIAGSSVDFAAMNFENAC